MNFYPDLMTDLSGKKITDASMWPARKKEIVDILSREEYGFMPPVYGETKGEIIKTDNECAGHGIHEDINISFPTEKGEFTFPIRLVYPISDKKVPVIVYMSFSNNLADHYIPLEEIIDHGFAIAEVFYKDVTSDDDDMTEGLTGMFTRPTDGSGFGKISIWAYGMSRTLDYLLTRKEFDSEKTACQGHSRLGKTALWCGANDDRFHYVISNDSGCGGAAYERTKHTGGETIADMNVKFPYWFCENRMKYAGKEDTMPFDQHFLLAASAPNNVLVGSAHLDLWADPLSEQMSCLGASPAFELFGKGFTGTEEPAKIGDNFDGGKVAYHLRHGRHFMSRYDWNCYMEYIMK